MIRSFTAQPQCRECKQEAKQGTTLMIQDIYIYRHFGSLQSRSAKELTETSDHDSQVSEMILEFRTVRSGLAQG